MNVYIIGLGKVGRTLLNAYKTINNCKIFIYDRDKTKINNVIDNNKVFPVYEIKDYSEADVIFVTVIDNKILETMDEIAKEYTGTIVLMSASIKMIDAVKHIKSNNNLIIMHPVQTFINPYGGRETFKGIFFTVEYTGSKRFVEEFCEEFDCEYIVVNKDFNRALYHIACLFASNFIVILSKMASELLENSNIAEHNIDHILIPIMKKTVDNISKHGIKESLTGPVMRGDLDIIEQHLSEMKDHKIKKIYKILIEKNIEMVENQHIFNLEKIKEIIENYETDN